MRTRYTQTEMPGEQICHELSVECYSQSGSIYLVSMGLANLHLSCNDRAMGTVTLTSDSVIGITSSASSSLGRRVYEADRGARTSSSYVSPGVNLAG